jgi:hypothetical protein
LRSPCRALSCPLSPFFLVGRWGVHVGDCDVSGYRRGSGCGLLG